MYTYIGTYTYIYIYTLAESRYALSYTLVTQTMLALPPTGVPFTFTFIFSFSSKIQKQNSNRSASHVPQETCCKTTVISLAQKKAAPFFFQLAHWGERSWSSCRSIPHFEIQPKNLAHCLPANWPFHRAQVKKEFIL